MANEAVKGAYSLVKIRSENRTFNPYVFAKTEETFDDLFSIGNTKTYKKVIFRTSIKLIKDKVLFAEKIVIDVGIRSLI